MKGYSPREHSFKGVTEGDIMKDMMLDNNSEAEPHGHWPDCRASCIYPIDNSPLHIAAYGYACCIVGHDDHECTCEDEGAKYAERMAERAIRAR